MLLVSGWCYFLCCRPLLWVGSGLGISDAPLMRTSLDPMNSLALFSLDQLLGPVSPGISPFSPAEPPVNGFQGGASCRTGECLFCPFYFCRPRSTQGASFVSPMSRALAGSSASQEGLLFLCLLTGALLLIADPSLLWVFFV